MPDCLHLLFSWAFWFPKKLKEVHLLTAVGFIFWKSELSTTLICLINDLGAQMYRVVDYSDFIALTILPFSYYECARSKEYNIKPLAVNTLLIISAGAFMATSQVPAIPRKHVSIDKAYSFNFSKRELVTRLNMVQLKQIERMNKYYRNIDFDKKTGAFHYTNSNDTIALLLDYKQLKETDTIRFKTSYAEIMLSGNDKTSELKLISAYSFDRGKDKSSKESVTELFEKNIVKPIRKYQR